MKYSIIIPYRNREEHLTVLLPRLKEIFNNDSYEIVVAEQDDADKFQKNSLYNLAALRTQGELIVFHDVDYYPGDDVSYDTEATTPLYPVRQVLFLDNKNSPRAMSDIPGGYQNFINDVGDHSGGVFVLSRVLFMKTNGLNPYYRGWGKEDDDTRDRLRLLGYNWKRNGRGLFYGLYHLDSKPDDSDSDFINNHKLLSNLRSTLSYGYGDVTARVEEFKLEENVKWIKVSDFKYAVKDL